MSMRFRTHTSNPYVSRINPTKLKQFACRDFPHAHQAGRREYLSPGTFPALLTRAFWRTGNDRAREELCDRVHRGKFREPRSKVNDGIGVSHGPAELGGGGRAKVEPDARNVP